MDMFKKYFKTVILVLIVAVLSGAIFYTYGYKNAIRDYGLSGEELEQEVSDSSEEELLEEKNTLSILACGDIMSHMPQVRSAYDEEARTYDFNGVFRHVKPIIESADIAIGNLETVIHPESELSGFPNFNSPTELVSALSANGFDLLSTANNHSFDRGKDGVISTIDAIENNGMIQIGSNRDISVNRTRILEENSIKIGFMCYTYGLNGHINDDDHLINITSLDKFKEDIDYLNSENVDKIVLIIHWGNEYNTNISWEQEEIANAAIEMGVDYILGSHPHVVQKLEVIGEGADRKLIMYSMGNFISNQRFEYTNNPYTEDGMMIQLKLERNAESGEVGLSDVQLIPTWVNRYNDGKWRYEILPVMQTLNSEVDDIVIGEDLRVKLENSLNRQNEINGVLDYR
ncbi:MAG: CapA family protein [Tissierellia bacterium]|nr:CapA family protein [Tissierellia bacterium]